MPVRPTGHGRFPLTDIPRCQSCGHPLGPGFTGTRADGSFSPEFCRECYQHGAYTEPDLSFRDMLERTVQRLRRETGWPEEKVRPRAEADLSSLKRWSGRPA